MIIAGTVAINLVYLRFDLIPLPGFAHIGSIDFIVEVADITDYTAALKG